MERKAARKNYINLFGTLFFFGVYVGLIYVQKGDIELSSKVQVAHNNDYDE